MRFFNCLCLVLLLPVAACCIWAMDSCGEEVSAAPDILRIQEKGELVVAMHYEDGAPFYSLNEKGEMVGIDIDLANIIAEHLGVKLRFNRSPKTFDQVVDVVASRKADLGISVLSRTTKRAVKVKFTQPYLRLYYALLINRVNMSKAGAAKDPVAWLGRKSSRVATIRGSAYEGFAKDVFPEATRVMFDSFNKAAEEVIAGNVDGLLYDNSMIDEWIDANPDKVLYVDARVLKGHEDPISIAVNQEDEHLHYWLNVVLEGMIKDGSLEKLLSKHLKPEKK